MKEKGKDARRGRDLPVDSELAAGDLGRLHARAETFVRRKTAEERRKNRQRGEREGGKASFENVPTVA